MFADSPIDIAIHCTKDFLRNDMFPVLPVSSDNRIKHSDDFSDGLTLMTRKVSPIFFFAFCLLPLLGLMNSLFPVQFGTAESRILGTQILPQYV